MIGRLWNKKYMVNVQNFGVNLSSKANSDAKIMFDKIIHLLDQGIRKMLVNCLHGNLNSTFWSMIYLILAFNFYSERGN